MNEKEKSSRKEVEGNKSVEKSLIKTHSQAKNKLNSLKRIINDMSSKEQKDRTSKLADKKENAPSEEVMDVDHKDNNKSTDGQSLLDTSLFQDSDEEEFTGFEKKEGSPGPSGDFVGFINPNTNEPQTDKNLVSTESKENSVTNDKTQPKEKLKKNDDKKKTPETSQIQKEIKSEPIEEEPLADETVRTAEISDDAASDLVRDLLSRQSMVPEDSEQEAPSDNDFDIDYTAYANQQIKKESDDVAESKKTDDSPSISSLLDNRKTATRASLRVADVFSESDDGSNLSDSAATPSTKTKTYKKSTRGNIMLSINFIML